MLQPDQKDYLAVIYQELRNPGSSEPPDQPFVPAPYAVRVNSFLFAGLFISMMVAFLSMLVKVWTRGYQRDLEGISSAHLRSRLRHYRYVGAEKWGFIPIVGFLSLFMHLALFVSAIGIIDLLFSTCSTVGAVALVIFALGVLAFLVAAFIPLFAPDAPFRSPWSRVLASWKGKILALFQPKNKQNKQSRDGTGLEDTVERPLEGQNDDYKVVRYRPDLDLEILCHLLNEADNSTQRWVLDLCFQKLPELGLLQEKYPRLILEKRVITEVYMFLARTCIGMVKGKRVLFSTRIDRAVQLCKFLNWYLSIPRTPELSHSLRSRLPDDEVNELPTALARDSLNPVQALDALAAKGRLRHLKEDQTDKVQCQICLAAMTELEIRVKADVDRANDLQNQSVQDTPENRPTLVEQFRDVLVQTTDCILDTEKRSREDKSDTVPQKKCHLFYEKVASIVKLYTESLNAKAKLIKSTELKAFVDAKKKNLDENSIVVTEWFNKLEVPLTSSPSPTPVNNTSRATTPVNGTATGLFGSSNGSPNLRGTSGSNLSPSTLLVPPPSGLNQSLFSGHNPRNLGSFGP
jgi:hypothetical protein